MSGEFLDTNVIVYAHTQTAGPKHGAAVALLQRLLEERSGALSVQVLSEFYSAATKKFAMTSQTAEEILADFAPWTIHRPGHADLLRAAALQRRYKMSWWDALIVNSAIELECATLWSEDLSHGQRFGSVTARNPFR
jgi:predicted nucleic acid-binding protein